MITVRKLAGGGDKEHEQMISIANMVGVDLIELLWIPRNKMPYHAVVTVVGYKKPVLDRTEISFDDTGETNTKWIDSIIKFYPDEFGQCYALIYDCPENRELLASSLSTNWFRIVDKSIRSEIIELAKSKGYEIEPTPITVMKVKKSKEEVDAVNKAKALEKKMEEMAIQMEKLKREHAIANNEKNVQVGKRAAGVKVPADTVTE